MTKALYLLAYRFIWNTHEKSIAAMTTICFLSIALSSCALALVAAIMSGFEHETRSIIQGVHPDLTIQAGGRPLQFDNIRKVLHQEYAAQIAGLSPALHSHVLIKSAGSQAIGALGMLIGIDPASEPTVSKLPTFVKEKIQKDSAFTDLFRDEQVLIGQTLAHTLGARVGDALTLLSSSEQATTDEVMLEQHPAKVGGIFKTGVDEVDSHVIFSNVPFFKTLFPERGITQIGIKLADAHQEESMKAQLKERLGLTVLSWKDLYPALLSALVLEKYAMFLVLALITLIACINIMSLLFMYTTHKKAEIAVLKTLGLKTNELIKLFVFMGMSIAIAGAIVGVTLAVAISWLINRYQLIKLPDIYYVSHLPAHMSFAIALMVVVLVSIVSCIAAMIPAFKMGTFDVSHLLKESG